jgi:hypothetical protein
LRIDAVNISLDSGLQLSSVDANGGIVSISPELTFAGLRLRSADAGGNELTTKILHGSKPGELSGNVSKRSDVVPTTMLSARSYPDSTHEAGQLSVLLRAKQEFEVCDALRIIEPNVQRVEVLSEPSGPAIYLDIGLDALVPAAVCGEGTVRLLSIILELLGKKNGVILIDEIDNGLHYSVMPGFWRLLGELVDKYQVQIFGTTHNEDIIRSALDSFEDKDGMLGLFRIDKRSDRHVMVAYNAEAMEAVREQHFEVRG